MQCEHGGHRSNCRFCKEDEITRLETALAASEKAREEAEDKLANTRAQRDIEWSDSRKHQLRAAQLEEALRAEKCKWEMDDDGVWDTSCGESFVIIDGTPEENSMRFCAYCGGSLKAVRKYEEGK